MKDSVNIAKESRKINNGLKELVTARFGEGRHGRRPKYAREVVRRIKKEYDQDVTENVVYMIVNNFTHLRPDNLHIAKVVKDVLAEFDAFEEQKRALVEG